MNCTQVACSVFGQWEALARQLREFGRYIPQTIQTTASKMGLVLAVV